MGGRKESERYEELPGPGQYSLKSLAVEGPQYSLKPRFPEKIPETPGPGMYETDLKSSRGITMG